METNVIIFPGARELIMGQGGVITLKVENRLIPGCSESKIAAIPVVQAGEPDEGNEAYQVVTVDDVKVYVHPTLTSGDNPQELRIGVETTLFDRRLMVIGAAGNNMHCGSCSC
ncbi:MAG TPA: CC/Se motif family (seleno)protein [Methylomusa anaerophila]|uniref:Iron-sulfur cluster insertion protein ErpA n=1 Tax=Methylomusa anaerophila TaxID=1930071 RepID=A0A348ANS9_9FIRM|nr:CC/Se motif family (seleno)protein [Methylomusa anaerophila]BBB92727.1 hypothetical protein MAMMFC1_03422 [Methylomusa anaerophila]HML87420.1 CC/Se motif family (seleno)protein [Methylomusa anaerophila]